MNDKDFGLNVMPLYRIGGIITNVCSLMVSGASSVRASSLSMSTMKPLKLFGITYFSSVPTVHSQRLQIFMDASVEDREAVTLTKLTTGAVHCLDALAVMLPLETGVALFPTHGMSECMPMAEILYTFMLCFMVLNPAVCKVHDGKGQFYGITTGFVAAAGIDVSSAH